MINNEKEKEKKIFENSIKKKKNWMKPDFFSR